jgi:hypothetical protein
MTNPLGMEITRNPTTGSILITQSKLSQSLHEEMHMQDSNPRTLPLDPNIKLTKYLLDVLHIVVPESEFSYMKVVGTLLHLVNYTRPYLAHTVGLLCRFNFVPGPLHIVAARCIMRYLNGTRHLGVSYSFSPTPLQGYYDSD